MVTKRFARIIPAVVLAMFIFTVAVSAVTFNPSDLGVYNEDAKNAARTQLYNNAVGQSTQRVYDYMGYLSNDEITELENYIATLRTETGRDFVVLISDDAGNGGEFDSQAYADDFYDYNLFGNVDNEYSGYLFFIDMANRLMTISTCGDMTAYINDSREGYIFDEAAGYIGNEDYYYTCYSGISMAYEFFLDGLPEGQYFYADESISRVYDNSNVLSESDIAYLDGICYNYRSGYPAIDFAVITDVSPTSDATYAKIFHTTLANEQVGMLPDAFIIYINTATNKLTFYYTGAVSEYLTAERYDKLLADAQSLVNSGDYSGAFAVVMTGTTSYFEAGVPNTLTGTEAIVAVIIGLVAALIFRFSVASSYSLKGSTYSYDLSSNATVTLTGKADDYLRTTVSKTRRNTDSGSGDGRGSGGSGIHISSSGRSHGGGSRGF